MFFCSKICSFLIPEKQFFYLLISCLFFAYSEIQMCSKSKFASLHVKNFYFFCCYIMDWSFERQIESTKINLIANNMSLAEFNDVLARLDKSNKIIGFKLYSVLLELQ